MRTISIAILLLLTIQANAACKYEARIRLGLVWHIVNIETEKSLSRKELIARLAQKYNFHDVSDIYEIKGCAR